MPDFPSNCVAFVTGAASGIGRAVAERLVSDGVENIALIDITAERLQDTVKSLASISSTAQVLAIGTDCSKEDQVESAVEECVSKFKRMDVCFNGAGISGNPNATAEMKSADMDRVLDINLKGVWYCERAQIRQMLKQEERAVATGLPLKTRGAIVNAGSLTSHIGLSTVSPYVMAKHGVLGLTKTDTVDYAKHGIRVNCVCPGWIITPMTKSYMEGPEGGQALAARTPMNRCGLPEEIAYTVGYLLSDRASFMTGAAVDVNGGYLCQ